MSSFDIKHNKINTGFWAGLLAWLFGGEMDSEDLEENKDYEDFETEEFCCESCNRRISKEEYDEHGGLCRYCRGAPTQRGFPSLPGFPKM